MSHPLVISYYTPNTPYEAHANRSQAALRRLGLPYRIEPREAKSSWVENCAQKAIYIRDIWHEVEQPVLWVDADGTMIRPMHEVANCTADIAVVKNNGWRFRAGQIYFGVTDVAEQILEVWCNYCEQYPHIWDQVLLGYAWWDVALNTIVDPIWLPDSIRETRRGYPAHVIQKWFSKAAVVHRKESRKSKASQTESAVEEFGSDDLPLWWRQAAIKEKPFLLSQEQRVELGLC